MAEMPDIPEGMVFDYRFTLRSRERHDWCLIGNGHGESRVGINIWAEPDSMPEYGRKWFGGVEIHTSAPRDYQDGSKPSHEHCWLLCGPCWHDGTSLYFSENIADMIPDPSGSLIKQDAMHRYMFGELMGWFRRHSAELEDE